MTVTMIGVDSLGVPAIKITRGNINPVTEPDSNVGSFYYNSKWAADYKIAGIDLIPQVGSNTFYPSGSSYGNFAKFAERYTSARVDSQSTYYRSTYFPNLSYTLPLIDVKARRISNGRFVNGQLNRLIYGAEISGARRNGIWSQPSRSFWGWATNYNVFYRSGSVNLSSGTLIYSTFRDLDNTPDGESFYNNLTVWNLPGNNTAIIDGSPLTPVSGATVVQIDSNGARVAKPGFNLLNITRPSQLAFDSARSPTKIIGAGDIACPTGVTNYDIGVTIPPNAQADVHFYTGSSIAYPMSPTGTTDQLFGSEYWLEGSMIRFNNTNSACRARFIIYADSTESVTSGNNDVLRQFTSNGENVVQLLRPGSANPPRFADIVVDSRWPCIQILANGYIPVGNGVLTHTVNFNASGCFPMVKYMTVHPAGTSNTGDQISWSARVRTPFFARCAVRNGPTWEGNITGDSTWCTLTQSQAVFRTYRGQPIALEYSTLQQYDSRNPTVTYDQNPLSGIRYYILGIPQT